MKKYREMIKKFRNKGNAIIAFSGGKDSSLVAKAAVDSGIRSIAVMINSPLIPSREIRYANRIADEIGIEIEFVEKKLSKNVAKNDDKRCFYCRMEDAILLKKFAEMNGYGTIADGINYDDDYIGKKAMDMYGIWHPLIELKIGEEEVKKILRELNISSWNKKPESCLATRINGKIREDDIKIIERAEDFVLKYVDFVRVRKFSTVARIEVMENDVQKLIEKKDEIEKRLKKIGFEKIFIDEYKKQK